MIMTFFRNDRTLTCARCRAHDGRVMVGTMAFEGDPVWVSESCMFRVILGPSLSQTFVDRMSWESPASPIAPDRTLRWVIVLSVAAVLATFIFMLLGGR